MKEVKHETLYLFEVTDEAEEARYADVALFEENSRQVLHSRLNMIDCLQVWYLISESFSSVLQLP